MSIPASQTFIAATVVVGCVCAVLPMVATPASATRTGGPGNTTPSALAAAATPALLMAPTTSTPVTPDVREFRVNDTSRGATVLSTPRRARGFSVVGATWAGRATAGLELAVRTRTGRQWSTWTPLEVVTGEHGPDPGSAEGRSARQGTDAVVVGAVDDVQVRAASPTGGLPRDLRLSVVNPRHSPADDDAASVQRVVTPAVRTTAAAGVPRPVIRSRAAWGANERLRSRRPTYGTVRAGFVHHTVNSNGYTRAQVPAIIRGIYAYHTQSLGWSDIGYNFLVDRFGRIWEGRHGGVARDVIGAHTYGYNHVSFAMSAIGNFQKRRPPLRMLRAYGQLMAWKLAINGVRAGDRRQRLAGRGFRAISGHRDAGQTACPGRYLYRKLPVIRRIASRVQRGATGTAPQPSPTPTPTPPPPLLPHAVDD